MAPEEKEASVDPDVIARLKERRNNRKRAVHNVHLAAFHDTRATFRTIRREVRAHRSISNIC